MAMKREDDIYLYIVKYKHALPFMREERYYKHYEMHSLQNNIK